MEEKALSAALFSLFDRQRYEENERLSSLIRETESRYGDHAISDDALGFVNAAGEQMLHRREAQSEDDEL